MKSNARKPVYLVASAYLVAAACLFIYAEQAMPIALPRLLVTVVLVYTFPIVAGLTWVLSGANILRRARRALALVAVLGVLLWLGNTSLFMPADTHPYLIAHRGVHQVMRPEHNRLDRCLGRIAAPEHDFIENTIPAIEAAFDAGARIVEIDIRPTRDGHFVVFHDDMLDCKTEAAGPVLEHSLAELQTLDAGFGYFTEEGSHPLRGKGIGMIRSLHEVLDAFPRKQIFIDVKFGNDRELWERLIDYLARRAPQDLHRITVHGVPRGAELVRQALPEIGISSYERAFRCARDYMLIGWAGYVPAVCKHAITGTYVETGWLFWGWPRRFVARMEDSQTIVLMRPRGQTEPEFARSIPADYTGGILTDRIERFEDWMNGSAR